MTDERVEPTKEWLDALIHHAFRAPSGLNPDAHYVWNDISQRRIGAEILRDAILASQPERVECRHPKERVEMLARVDTETVRITPLGHALPLSWSPICRACGADVPAAGQSLKGANE